MGRPYSRLASHNKLLTRAGHPAAIIIYARIRATVSIVLNVLAYTGLRRPPRGPCTRAEIPRPTTALKPQMTMMPTAPSIRLGPGRITQNSEAARNAQSIAVPVVRFAAP